MPKIVYIPMSADIIHPGHIKIINAGAALGEVTVGLLTDDIITKKKHHTPIMSYEDRREIVQSIKGVSDVIAKESMDYRPNLLQLKPDYVVHGDDWSNEVKQQIVETIREWSGQIIELPYTPGISSTLLRKKIRESDR